VDIGLFLGAGVPPATPGWLRAVAQAADQHGVTSLWLGEHVVLFDVHDKRYPYAESGDFPIKGEGGMAEPFTTLAYLAGVTSRVRLGTGVCLVPQRNPLYTAEEVANVDWLSDGRFDFGIGVGWQREEFEALGVPFERRGRRTDEYIELMRRLWCDDVSSFQGEFWSLPPCRAYPKPVQQPHPPIHIGGESDVALRRVVRLGAHWFPFDLDPPGLAERRALLARMLEGTGRSIDDVRITVYPDRRSSTPAHVGAFAEAGAHQVVLRVPRGPEDELGDAVASLVEACRRERPGG
jgi:probable F420-dependent oxidoreductase